MAFKHLSIIDTIDSVVDSMRIIGDFTATFDGTKSVVTTKNDFKNYDVLEIGGINYIINDVTENGFEIQSDVSGESEFKTCAPYFEYGHIKEILKTLMDKDKATKVLSFKKYPLVMLLLDVKYDYNKSFKTFDYNNLTILIVNKTNPNYKAKDRKEKSFEPILHPLYELFIENLSKSDHINTSNNIPFIDHSGFDRYFWGSQLNSENGKNQLNDFLDAVEIQNLNIRVKQIKC